MGPYRACLCLWSILQSKTQQSSSLEKAQKLRYHVGAIQTCVQLMITYPEHLLTQHSCDWANEWILYILLHFHIGHTKLCDKTQNSNPNSRTEMKYTSPPRIALRLTAPLSSCDLEHLLGVDGSCVCVSVCVFHGRHFSAMKMASVHLRLLYFFKPLTSRWGCSKQPPPADRIELPASIISWPPR